MVAMTNLIESITAPLPHRSARLPDAKMIAYKTLTRTTLAEMDDIPYAGLYIIAYMGRILYVGKATDSIAGRIANHVRHRDVEMLGFWLDSVRFDWANVRLDCLEMPDDVSEVWLREAEAKLVRRLNPLFNKQLMA